jgi:hypothetical protein
MVEHRQSSGHSQCRSEQRGATVLLKMGCLRLRQRSSNTTMISVHTVQRYWQPKLYRRLGQNTRYVLATYLRFILFSDFLSITAGEQLSGPAADLPTALHGDTQWQL